MGFQGRLLRRGDVVDDALVRRGVGDLVGAGVGGDDAGEVGGEAVGGLSVAGGAVPGEVARRAQRGQVGKERLGVARPVAGVGRGVGAEVVFEGGVLCVYTSEDGRAEKPRILYSGSWYEIGEAFPPKSLLRRQESRIPGRLAGSLPSQG